MKIRLIIGWMVGTVISLLVTWHQTRQEHQLSMKRLSTKLDGHLTSVRLSEDRKHLLVPRPALDWMGWVDDQSLDVRVNSSTSVTLRDPMDPTQELVIIAAR